MKRLSGYPNWFYKMLLVAMITILLSGLLMIPTMLEFKLDMDVVWRLSGEHRLNAAAIHTIFGWLLMMQAGALWHAHMRAGWRKALNRPTGLGSALVLVGLTASAIALFYLGSSTAQTVSAITHTTLGILFALCMIAHMLIGQKIYRQKRERLANA